jgi:hypothetical protein
VTCNHFTLSFLFLFLHRESSFEIVTNSLMKPHPRYRPSSKRDRRSTLRFGEVRDVSLRQLYVKLYPDQLTRSPSVEGFVQGVWTLVGSGRLPGLVDDGVRILRDEIAGPCYLVHSSSHNPFASFPSLSGLDNISSSSVPRRPSRV